MGKNIQTLKAYYRDMVYYTTRYNDLKKLLEGDYSLEEVTKLVKEYTKIDLTEENVDNTYAVKRAKKIYWRYGRMNHISYRDLKKYGVPVEDLTIMATAIRRYEKQCEQNEEEKIYWDNFLKFAEESKINI